MKSCHTIFINYFHQKELHPVKTNSIFPAKLPWNIMLKLIILGIAFFLAYRFIIAPKNKQLPPDTTDEDEDLFVEYEEVDDE